MNVSKEADIMPKNVIDVSKMTDAEVAALDKKFEKATRDMVFTGTGYGLKRGKAPKKAATKKTVKKTTAKKKSK